MATPNTDTNATLAKAAENLALAYDKIHYDVKAASLIERYCERIGAQAPLPQAVEEKFQNAISGAVTMADPVGHERIIEAYAALERLPVPPGMQKATFDEMKLNAFNEVWEDHLYTPLKTGIARARVACSQPKQFRP